MSDEPTKIWTVEDLYGYLDPKLIEHEVTKSTDMLFFYKEDEYGTSRVRRTDAHLTAESALRAYEAQQKKKALNAWHDWLAADQRHQRAMDLRAQYLREQEGGAL